MKKKKLTVMIIFLFTILLFCLFLFNSYELYINKQLSEMERVVDYNIDDDKMCWNLKENDKKIVQNFTSNKPLTGIDFYVKVKKQESFNAEIKIMNVDNGDVLYQDVSNIPISDEGYVRISFDKYNYQGTNYEYQIQIDGIGEFAVAVSEDNQYPNGILRINEKQQNGDLCFRLITQSDNSEVKKWFVCLFAFGVFVISLFNVLIWVLPVKRIENIFIISIFLYGSIYMFIMTPNSAPDSIVHTVSAYHYSNEMMGINDDIENNLIYMRSEDVSMQNLYDKQPNLINYQKFIYFSRNQVRDTELKKVEVDGITKYPILSFPAAMGITLARILNLNTVGLLLTGQILNLIFYAFLVYFAIKIIPFGKLALLIASTCPMTLSTVASFSYDATLIGLAWFFIAYIFWLMNYQKSHIKVQHIIVMAISMCLIIPNKAVYAVFALLPFCVIDNKAIRDKIKWCMMCCGLLIMSAVTTIAYNYSTVSAIANEDILMGEEILKTYSIGTVLKEPLHIFFVFLNTFFKNISYYIKSMFGSHLGWWDIEINEIFVILMIGIFTFAALSDRGQKASHLSKAIICIICLGIYGLTCCSMLFAFTTEGAIIISGVQGRYFLPLIPLFSFLLSQLTWIKVRANKIFLMYCSVILQVFIVADICLITLCR